jgi:hypothetical protein
VNVKWSEERQLYNCQHTSRETPNHRPHSMARLAAAGVLATPEQTETSEEQSLNGAGAMAVNDASSSARQHELGSDDILADNTANIGAMGQNESREDLRSRNAAIRHAGTQAVIPRSGTGKLPRRSGLGSQVVTGQRRLGNNVLANARTYDVPSDEDSRPRKKQVTNKSAFSPLKRQTKQPQREVETWRASQEQIALDLQLAGDEAEEITENRREESNADLTHDNDAGEDDADMDAGNAESAVEHIQRTEAPKKKRGRPSKPRELVRQDPTPQVPVELVAEPVQQNSVPKRKVGTARIHYRTRQLSLSMSLCSRATRPNESVADPRRQLLRRPKLMLFNPQPQMLFWSKAVLLGRRDQLLAQSDPRIIRKLPKVLLQDP